MSESISITIPTGNKKALRAAAEMLMQLVKAEDNTDISYMEELKPEFKDGNLSLQPVNPDSELTDIEPKDEDLFTKSNPPIQSELLAITIDTNNMPVTMLTNGAELDSEKLQWDSRIHNKEKKKLKNTGQWKLIRGVDKELVKQVRAELILIRDEGDPTAQGRHTTVPADIIPAVTTPAVTTPAVTTSAVTTPAVTTPAVTTPISFPDFIAKITNRQTSPLGQAFAPNILPILKKYGFESIMDLLGKSNEIILIDQELDTVWDNLNTPA